MEEEYEVPSPHEHAVEEAVEKERDGLAQKVALMTAILSTIGALISYQSGAAQNEAMFLKNQSILKQAEASDQWAFYESKSTKSHLDDVAASLSDKPEIKERFLADRDKQERQKAEIKKDAEKLQAESRKLNEESEATLKPHERMALGMTLHPNRGCAGSHYGVDQKALADLGIVDFGRYRTRLLGHSFFLRNSIKPKETAGHGSNSAPQFQRSYAFLYM